jgi:hypothetical protein
MAELLGDCSLGEEISTNYGLRIAALFAILASSFIGGILPLITRHAKTGGTFPPPPLPEPEFEIECTTGISSSAWRFTCCKSSRLPSLNTRNSSSDQTNLGLKECLYSSRNDLAGVALGSSMLPSPPWPSFSDRSFGQKRQHTAAIE